MTRWTGHALALAVLWLALSGLLSGLLIALGLASALGVALLERRMARIDRDPRAIPLRWDRFPGYFAWLAVAVTRSNIDVARRILSPDLPISPAIEWLPAEQTSEMGRVIYANSITLTPGTVSIDLGDDRVEVHALVRESLDELGAGEMASRVRALEVGS